MNMASAGSETTATDTPSANAPTARTQGVGKQLTIRGPKVHDVGYRVFLLDAAYAYHMEKFEVHDLVQDGEQTVVVRFGSLNRQRFEEYEIYIRKNYPEEAQVRAIDNSAWSLVPIQSYERTALNLQTKQLYKGVGVIKHTSEKTHQKLDGLGEKIDGLGDRMDRGFGGLGEKMDRGFGELGEKMDRGFGGLGEKLDALPERIAKAMNRNNKDG